MNIFIRENFWKLYEKEQEKGVPARFLELFVELGLQHRARGRETICEFFE